MSVERPQPSTGPDLMRRALLEPWPDDSTEPVLFFERYLAAERQAAAEQLLGGGDAVERFEAAARALDLSRPRTTVHGVARQTLLPEHRGWPVDLAGDGPWIELQSSEGTLVASVTGRQIDALWLDGPLPFGDRRITYRPRSELEAAESLAAAAAPLELGFLRTEVERRNDRFAGPPDLEATWRLAGLLDELADQGRRASELDALHDRAKEREAILVADWIRRRQLTDLLTGLEQRVGAAGGRLTLNDIDVRRDKGALEVRSLVCGASFGVDIAQLREGALALRTEAWDGRSHALAVGPRGPATELPPLDVVLDVVLELCTLEDELGLAVH